MDVWRNNRRMVSRSCVSTKFCGAAPDFVCRFGFAQLVLRRLCAEQQLRDAGFFLRCWQVLAMAFFIRLTTP